MDVLAVDDLECLRAVPGLEHAVALGGEVDAQGGDDVFFIVADKNIIHDFLLRNGSEWQQLRAAAAAQ